MGNINIKINGISNKDSAIVVSELEKIITSFSFMDFRRFEDILITNNFDEDIEKLTHSSNHLSNRYRRNNDTFASVLTIPKNEEFRLYLVFQSNLIKKLLTSKDSQEYKEIIHVIHHELAHIHDNNKKLDVFKELIKTKKYSGKSSLTYPIAETCWSEYIANFISSTTAIETEYPKQMAKSLISKIEDTKKDLEVQLYAYKINRKREDLVQNSIEKVRLLLKSASYLIGYLNGMKITLEELDYELNYELEVSYFKDIWEVLKYELASIHQVYPHGFINLSIYKNLSFYIETFYAQMGIVLDENEGEQLRIHIM